ncbi:MAG TPA: O-acetyl-ADP-ribose deacetylase [Selenomonadales bacterium]|nr:O-acetyl-ADP-ribose deacetylase [Selenomonadales bacterium]
MKLLWRGTVVEAVRGDITEQAVEALVNAANSRLAGGGGVDGAIHVRGGPAIMQELDLIRARQGGCPAGQAVITGAGRLKAKYVIHTVGPVYSGQGKDAELLASCYRSSLQIAADNGVHSLAFPSISTGVYRYPIEKAAPIAINTVMTELPSYYFRGIRFILFSDRDYEVYRRLLAARAEALADGTPNQGGCHED